MSAQAQLLRGRSARGSASAPVQAAPYGAGPSSTPQITLSPQCPATGRPTTGFMFMVASGTVTTLTVWLRDPHTLFWGALASFDVPNDALAPFKWITVCGVNACELWFQTNADGGAAILILEQSGG